MKKLLAIALLSLLLLTGCSRACTAHTDADGDQICDSCGGSTLVIIDIYAINDLHGKIMDGTSHPGVDELTTYLNAARETDDHVLLLSVGDMWQGSAESNLTRGQLMTEWMNELDFSAMAMGNHEFDWGETPIEANAELAEFPFLAINIYDRETDQLVDYCQGSILVECGGVQIGVIGAIGDCYSSISSEQVQDVYFKTGAELTALVKAESEQLRTEGADLIVYLLHDGSGTIASGTVSDQQLSGYYSTELSDGYVDLVFEGHSHQQYLLEDSHGILHLQNGGDNQGGISHVELQIDSVTGETQIRQAELVSTTAYEPLEDDPLVEKLLTKYDADISPAFETVGTLTTSVPGNTLRQVIADLYYMEGLMHWGSEYDIFLGGGFISIRDPGYLARGEVTYAQLMGLFPFDNELVLCAIKGSDLKTRFLESDNSNYFISYGSYGEALLDNIDPNGTYYIVTDTYSSTYAPNRLTEIERYGDSIYARDLLAQYIAMGGLN